MVFLSRLRLVATFLVFSLLIACKSVEERAEEHYQSGLALIEAGDPDRALVELRNVFKLDGAHLEARRLYAETVRDMGRVREAYGQYLRLIEQYPQDLNGRLVLAEMAFAGRDWDEFDRHVAVVLDLALGSTEAEIFSAAQTYRNAAVAEDDEALAAALTQVETLFESHPDDPKLRMILIDARLQNDRLNEALVLLDQALEDTPESRELHQLKLNTYVRQQDKPEIETQLRQMIEIFEEDRGLHGDLIRYYMADNNLDAAEAYLRETARPDTEELDPYLELVYFLSEVRGPEEAIAELNRGIPLSPDPLRLRILRAGLDFGQGNQDQAVADIRDLLKEEETAERAGLVRISLATMLAQIGEVEEAKALVAETLAADPTSVEALKMQAAWFVEEDKTDEAISALRTVLDQAPQDHNAMLLMAEVYSRAGLHALSRDFLSLAVDTSEAAPVPSLRYATRLVEEDKPDLAKEILVTALQKAPGNEPLLVMLARLYLSTGEPERGHAVMQALRALGTDSALQSAYLIEAAIRAQEESLGGAVEFLERLDANAEGGMATKIAILRAHLASGETEKAASYIEQQLELDPQSPQLRYLATFVYGAQGNLELAIATMTALAEENPNVPQFWVQLSRMHLALDNLSEAAEAMDSGLEANPGSGPLLWAKASLQERNGDIDGAIEIYETLYALDSGSVVVANNLASLLSSYRDDSESLDRAQVIARRLQGSDVPAFQDTYGWLAYKRGDYQEALRYLEPAAEGLAEDPVVQYHLGAAYQAVNRTDDAIAQYELALDMVPDEDQSGPIQAAREQLKLLQELPQEDAQQ